MRGILHADLINQTVSIMKKLIDWIVVCIITAIAGSILIPTTVVLIVSSVIRMIAFRIFNTTLDAVLTLSSYKS